MLLHPAFVADSPQDAMSLSTFSCSLLTPVRVTGLGFKAQPLWEHEAPRPPQPPTPYTPSRQAKRGS